MDLNSRVDARVVANVDRRTYEQTNGWKTRCLYCAIPEAGVTKTSTMYSVPGTNLGQMENY